MSEPKTIACLTFAFTILIAVTQSTAVRAQLGEPTLWDDLTLPTSNCTEPLQDTTLIIASSRALHVNLDYVMPISEVVLETSPGTIATFGYAPSVPRLQEALAEVFQQRQRVARERGVNAGRNITVAADRDTTFARLEAILTTAYTMGLTDYQLLTMSSPPPNLRQSPDDLETGPLCVLSIDRPLQELMPATPDPHVLIQIRADGFNLVDLARNERFAELQLADPTPECLARSTDGITPTVCLLAGPSQDDRFIEHLDFRNLYNRLVEIRSSEVFEEEWVMRAPRLFINADPGVPYDALIRTLDVARWYLENDSYGNDEAFHSAQVRIQDDQPVELFPPVVFVFNP